mmetsp:Transcript_69763/g.102221  ORF Transcript_69763/g.102221 Transcript_69763/m.102221 type:complete len:93 (+) Transcript_69763:595-873(+)
MSVCLSVYLSLFLSLSLSLSPCLYLSLLFLKYAYLQVSLDSVMCMCMTRLDSVTCVCMTRHIHVCVTNPSVCPYLSFPRVRTLCPSPCLSHS